jgi:hypothetical protein
MATYYSTRENPAPIAECDEPGFAQKVTVAQKVRILHNKSAAHSHRKYEFIILNFPLESTVQIFLYLGST